MEYKMICKKCGNEIPDGKILCKECGKKNTDIKISIAIIAVGIIASLLILILEKSNKNQTQEQYNTTPSVQLSISKASSSNSNTNEDNKRDVINKIIGMLDKNVEWLEDGMSRGKYIEDAWKENKEDEELSALYNYDTTLFYLDLDEIEKAKESMRKISPDYKGAYNKKITEQGLKLFGNKGSWEKQYKVAIGVNKRTEERQKDADKTFEKDVIKYMEERYLFYDKNQGKQDKYSKIVFGETSEKFNITLEEVDIIWSEPDYHKLVTMENQNITNDSGNISNESYKKEANNDEKGILWGCAKDAVTQSLKAPSTAEFPFSYLNEDIQDLGNGNYVVKSWVDAQNGFGAMIRSNFTVNIKKVGEGAFQAQDVSIK